MTVCPRRKRTTAIAVLLFCAGCGGSDGEAARPSIPDRPLSGTIAGQAWEAKSGRAGPAHDRTDVLFATFLPEMAPLCGSQLAIPYAHAYLPLVPGDYDAGTDLPGSFTAEDADGGLTIYLTFTGRISIEAVDESKIVGGLALELDDEDGFSIGGKFSVDRCSD